MIDHVLLTVYYKQIMSVFIHIKEAEIDEGVQAEQVRNDRVRLLSKLDPEILNSTSSLSPPSLLPHSTAASSLPSRNNIYLSNLFSSSNKNLKLAH